ncbi:uncharacterized protein LOC126800290 [Argentina anserina]|uniref:uncharacterized protein LOC126800290 n=1 Tax=Argentina anserina TaxID=57926 RepID=UPI00217654D2|nr:uncharacterized protein LOC126800290 [Potentilla anserina]
MGIPAAVTRSLKLSFVAYLVSAVLVLFLPHEFHNKVTVGRWMAEQITFYIGSFLVFLCWELSHHLHQTILDKQGSSYSTWLPQVIADRLLQTFVWKVALETENRLVVRAVYPTIEKALRANGSPLSMVTTEDIREIIALTAKATFITKSSEMMLSKHDLLLDKTLSGVIDKKRSINFPIEDGDT